MYELGDTIAVRGLPLPPPKTHRRRGFALGGGAGGGRGGRGRRGAAAAAVPGALGLLHLRLVVGAGEADVHVVVVLHLASMSGGWGAMISRGLIQLKHLLSRCWWGRRLLGRSSIHQQQKGHNRHLLAALCAHLDLGRLGLAGRQPLGALLKAALLLQGRLLLGRALGDGGALCMFVFVLRNWINGWVKGGALDRGSPPS